MYPFLESPPEFHLDESVGIGILSRDQIVKVSICGTNELCGGDEGKYDS